MHSPLIVFFILFIFAFSSCKQDLPSTKVPNKNKTEKDSRKEDSIVFKDTMFSDVKLNGGDTTQVVDTIKATKINLDKKTKEKPAIKKKYPKIYFEESVYEFGTITEGEIINHEFKFKNTGKAPLEIKSVEVSCGCTFPSYPYLPIQEGEYAEIGVRFNSVGKLGEQKPKLMVYSNASRNPSILYMKGTVMSKDSIN